MSVSCICTMTPHWFSLNWVLTLFSLHKLYIVLDQATCIFQIICSSSYYPSYKFSVNVLHNCKPWRNQRSGAIIYLCALPSWLIGTLSQKHTGTDVLWCSAIICFYDRWSNQIVKLRQYNPLIFHIKRTTWQVHLPTFNSMHVSLTVSEISSLSNINTFLVFYMHLTNVIFACLQ